MKHTIEKILGKYISGEEKIILACSTGADSMYLLSHLLETKYRDSIVIAYFNHNTREQCQQEEEFIINFGKRYHIPVEVGDCNFQKIQKLYPSKSFEELAREKRYQFFDALCHMYKTNFVMTAHHLDDRIETMMFHMIRGTKLTGLINMTEKSGNIIRPLISITKAEIYGFLDEKNIQYFEDESNQHNSYTRNYIRNEVIPSFAQVHPQYQKNIAHLLQYFESLKSHIDTEVLDFLAQYEKNTFSLHDFLLLSVFLQKEIIRFLYYISNNHSTIGLSEGNIEEILRFMKGKNNKTKKELQKLSLFKDGGTILVLK